MRFATLIATIGILAAACSSGDQAVTLDTDASATTPSTTAPSTTAPPTTAAPTTTPTTTAPSTTVDSEAQDRAEIEEVVQRFHAFYYEVGAQEGLPGLEEVATSPIYERSVETANDFISRGYTTGEGAQGHTTIEIRFIKPTSAEVEGCRLDEAPIVDKDGNEVTDRTPVPTLSVTEVVKVDGTWLVSDFRFKDGKATPCEL